MIGPLGKITPMHSTAGASSGGAFLLESLHVSRWRGARVSPAEELDRTTRHQHPRMKLT